MIGEYVCFHDGKASIGKEMKWRSSRYPAAAGSVITDPAAARRPNRGNDIFSSPAFGLLKALLVALLLMTIGGCGFLTNRSGKSYVIDGKRYHIMANASGYKQKGLASWYGEPFHGRKTASGEVYDMHQVTAAHKTLPLHTWVEVKNLQNNKRLVVRINDRGPFVNGRIIDLSRKAAEEMGMLNAGVAKVYVRTISDRKARQLLAREKNQGKAASAGE